MPPGTRWAKDFGVVCQSVCLCKVVFFETKHHFCTKSPGKEVLEWCLTPLHSQTALQDLEETAVEPIRRLQQLPLSGPGRQPGCCIGRVPTRLWNPPGETLCLPPSTASAPGAVCGGPTQSLHHPPSIMLGGISLASRAPVAVTQSPLVSSARLNPTGAEAHADHPPNTRISGWWPGMFQARS